MIRIRLKEFLKENGKMINKEEYEEAKEMVEEYEKEMKKNPIPDKILLSRYAKEEFYELINKCTEYIRDVHESGYYDGSTDENYCDTEVEELGIIALKCVYGADIMNWCKSKED